MQNLNLPLERIADTRVGRAVRHASEAHPATSGVYPLTASLNAFAARVLLMRAAERTLDIQCYMWQADITGCLLLEEARHSMVSACACYWTTTPSRA